MVFMRLRDRPHLTAWTRPSPNAHSITSAFPGVAASSMSVTTTVPGQTATSLIRSTISKVFPRSSSSIIPSGILSLPIELILEIGYHILDSNTLNNLIRSHPALACILSRQLYYRAFNWDKRAAIKTSKFHCRSRAILQEYVTRNGHGHTIRVLLDWYGLDITQLHHDPDYAIAILKGVHTIPSKGKRGPLHDAALRGHASICKVLLERAGAICSLQDTNEQDETPLHYAARSLWPSEIIAFLIDNGANIEAVNRSGRTPLHVAIVLNSIEAVRALLEKGANPFATVRNISNNPYDNAQINRYSAMELALAMQREHDEGHLVKESMLNNRSNEECIVQLLAVYEVNFRIAESYQTTGRDKSKFTIIIQGVVKSCKEMIKRIVR